MPTIALNDRTVAGLKPRGGRVDYFDRSLPGFGVRVGASGRKTFMLFHRVNGKLQRLTLRDPENDASTYPTLTLAKARELARGALQASTVGRDPHVEQQQTRERTFGKLAELYLEQHAKRKKRSWRDDARMIRQELDVWNSRPLTSIRRADVRDLLEGIVQRGAPVLANRVLALARKMFNFALDREWVDANVAAKMARPAAEQSRTRVLSEAEIKTVWTYLQQPAPKKLSDVERRQWRLTRAALQLRLITGQRGGEVLSMRRADVDASWWTIPTPVSKNNLPHRVYLSPMALAIVRPLLPKKEEAFVFAGIRGTRQRRGALEGLNISDVRPHDFRRTMATFMGSSGVPRLTIAKILNHVDKSVTAIYDRASYDAEKQAALTWWSTKLTAIISGKKTKVLPFAKSA
jgi:integrase